MEFLIDFGKWCFFVFGSVRVNRLVIKVNRLNIISGIVMFKFLFIILF